MGEISKGVMKKFEDDIDILYECACSCGDKDHNVDIEFTYDKEFYMVEMNFYKDVMWCASWEPTWYKNLWKRITGSLKMLLTGRIVLEESFLIEDLENMDNIITALIEGRRKLANSLEKQKYNERQIK